MKNITEVTQLLIGMNVFDKYQENIQAVYFEYGSIKVMLDRVDVFNENDVETLTNAGWTKNYAYDREYWEN